MSTSVGRVRGALTGRRIALILLVALCASITTLVMPQLDPAAAQATPIAVENTVGYYEMFDNNHPAGWSTVTSSGTVTWTTSSGKLTGNGTGSSTRVTGNPGWRNYDLSAEIDVASLGSGGSVGIVFGRDAATNSSLRYGYNSNGLFFQNIVGAAVTTTNLPTPGGFVATDLHTLRVVVDDDVIDFYLDNGATPLQQLSAPAPLTPPAPASRTMGKIGMDVKNANTTFDKVKNLYEVAQGFSFVVLPDTQFYTSTADNFFVPQTEWISVNRSTEKIAGVFHVGDVVASIGCSSQWAYAEGAMDRLDGRLPISVASGNHDVIQYGDPCPGAPPLNPEPADAFVGSGVFDQYFPSSEYAAFRQFAGILDNADPTLDEFGTYDDQWNWFNSSLDNSFQVFSAGGMDFIVVTLSFGPTPQALAWASQVLSNHDNHQAIIVTHDYLNDNGNHRGTDPACGAPDCEHALPGQTVPIPGEDSGNNGSDGGEMWRNFVWDNPNIRIVVNGHVTECLDGGGCSYTAGREMHTRPDGSRVLEMLANYQNRSDGGGGYLRVLTINPADDTVTVKTRTPSYIPGPSSPRPEYLTSSDNQFTVHGIFNGRYEDVTESHPFYDDIMDAQSVGLLSGYDGIDTYPFNPSEPANRRSAGVALSRALGNPWEEFGSCIDNGIESAFTDILRTDDHCYALARLEQLGIVSSDAFNPNGGIDRKTLAKWLFSLAGALPACTTAPFADVPASLAECSAIKKASTEGIMNPYADGLFHPGNAVDRQALAAIIVRFDTWCLTHVSDCS